VAYALTNAALYSMLLPLWEGFDEPFHFGYVQYLANGKGFPDPRTSPLSEEVAVSLRLAPQSISVQRNLPQVTSYPEFFGWPDSRRRETHQQLSRIDPNLRWRSSIFIDYEAQQAPLAYAVLALPERVLQKLRLTTRVLVLRILAAMAGSLLLLFGAERLTAQLGVPDPYGQIVIFCALSSQMIWATFAHVANDWLSVPLTLWLLVMLIEYNQRPSRRRAAVACGILALGLLTKAYCIAFSPLLALVCIIRRQWRDLAMSLAILTVLAGPWYLRNIERYGTISGMQELREGIDPAAALRDINITKIPAAIDAYARAALWTANNTFQSYSAITLRAVIVLWGAALALWVHSTNAKREVRHRNAALILLLHAALFAAALAYDTAINYVKSQGEARSPGAWYTQVLLVPMLALALRGTSRSGKLGKAIATALIALFAYILITTYWVKLIPLYAGFEGRTSLGSIATLYGEHASTVIAGLDEISLAPAAIILVLSMFVSVLAVVQPVILIRRLLGQRIS
jgi:hypothetical protein